MKPRHPPSQLDIQTLGAFHVLRGGEPIPDQGWGTHRAKPLLKVLLTHYGHAVVRDQIVEALWSDAAPHAATRNLYVAVSDLRHILEPRLIKPADSTFILSTDEGYRFNTDSPHTLDTILFERHLSNAHQAMNRHALDDAAQAYAQANALYAGIYLPDDVYADWSIGERERLRNLLLSMLLEYAEVQAQLGRYRQAIANCRRALELDNCLEEAYRGLMTYLYASGDRGQALRVYGECKATLKRELDTEPLRPTRELAREIQSQRVVAVDEKSKYPTAQPIALPYSLAQMPLVGRERELAQLDEIARAAKNTHGCFVFVEGETGIGKSYLVDAFLKNATATVLRDYCHELTASLQYHPLAQFVRAKREHVSADSLLARMFLDSSTNQNGKIDKPHLFDALTQFIISLDAVIVFEDLQWADDETLEFLVAIAPQISNQSILMIATCRPSERLQSLLTHAGRDAWLNQLALAPLDEAQVVALIEKLAPTQSVGRTLGQRIFKTTSGNPLFVASVLTRLFETGQLWRDQIGNWQGIPTLLAAPVFPIPDQVDALVAQRAASLSPIAKRVMTLAAVMEDSIDGQWLREAYSRAYDEPLGDASWLDVIDELTAADLIFATSDNLLAFRHDSIREALYARTSVPRRQHLHKTIGLLLEERTPNDVTRLAHHFSRSDDDVRAVRYLLDAGEQARNRYASTIALINFDLALKRIHETETRYDWHTELIRAEIGRAAIAYNLGMVEVRRNAIESLKKLVPQLNGSTQIDALSELAYLLSDAEQSTQVLELTDALLPQINTSIYTPAQRSKIWRVRGYVLWDLGRFAEAADNIQNALVQARIDGFPIQMIGALTYLAVIDLELHDLDGAIAAICEAEQVAERADKINLRFAVYINGFVVWAAAGVWSQAEDAIARAEKLYAEADFERVRPGLESNRGFLCLMQGKADEARAHFERAAILAEAQGKPSIVADARVQLGMAAARQRDWATSRAAFSEGITLLEKLGSKSSIVAACAHAALALLEEGDVSAAEKILVRADRNTAEPPNALYRFAQSRVLAARNKKAAAKKLHVEAQSIVCAQAARISDPDIRAHFLAHPHNRLILGQ